MCVCRGLQFADEETQRIECLGLARSLMDSRNAVAMAHIRAGATTGERALVCGVLPPNITGIRLIDPT